MRTAQTSPAAFRACTLVLGAGLTSAAAAVDLAVMSVEITQGGQFGGATTLVAGRPTMVRVKVGVTGQTTSQANVDAVLRMYVGGQQLVGSPYFSRNGPITAPVAPNSANVNDTVNFTVIAPVSTDVDFVVVVDPRNLVTETNEANNTYSLNNKSFVCRKVLDVAYVSVNYTPGGGQPVAATIEPGVGDNFMRGIYAVGELNYHRSPLGPLTWTSSINSSGAALLSSLSTIRTSTIPAAGFSRPEFIYGWLPGNPYSGNGVANGIPGDAAFGNTESSRFQRTFAHEIGHCWGRGHTSNTIAYVGFDVEHHLANPLALAQTHAASKYDVMVAGMLTSQAWVDSGTYSDCLTDSRSQCTAASGDGDGSGGGGATDAHDAHDAQRSLHLSGAYDHAAKSIELFPANLVEIVSPTQDDPRGDLVIQSFDARGGLLTSLRWKSGTTRESCASEPGHSSLHARSPVSVFIPQVVGGEFVARVEMRVLASGRLLASRSVSKRAPEILLLGSRLVSGTGVASHAGTGPFVEIFWNAADADGDPLRTDVHYSRDGGESWSAIQANVDGSAARLSLADIPAAIPGRGIVRLCVTDGLRVTQAEMPAALGEFGPTFEGGVSGSGDWSGFLVNNPPDIHLVSPNSNNSYPQGAAVLLHASGWDLEQQYLGDSAVTWTSSLAGTVGTGRMLLVKTLPVGTQTITLQGTDAEGLSVSKSVVIAVTARTLVTPDINGDWIVNGADLSAVLGNWGGTGLGDLDFDGVVGGPDLTVIISGWTG
ncbi:MAG: hypothetical protein EXS03_03550 [Phycisphaerales bacterium]|nr:hypothetical protein [Phycisphaerales bacterium]